MLQNTWCVCVCVSIIVGFHDFFLSFLRLEGDFNFSPFPFFLSSKPFHAPSCFLSKSWSFKKLLLHVFFFRKVLSIIYPSPCTLFYPILPAHPCLTLSVPNFLSTIQSRVFYLPSLEIPFPQTLSNFLISMGILNKKHIAEDSTITSHTDERKHLTFVFLGYLI